MSTVAGGEINRNDGKLKPVSIGFDAKRAFYNSSGLGNYSRNLLGALAKNYPENTYHLFTPKSKSRNKIENEGQFVIIEPQLTIFRMISPLWRLRYMIADIRRQKLDIFHGLSQELPFGIGNSGVKSVVTVHDLIFVRFPEYYNKIDVKIYYWKLRHACRVSDHIVAISQQTKDDLISFLRSLLIKYR